ncbi:uncharacterized protein LOC109615425 isoform X2 [Esox lucius]|uniref:uncharacterized protein LOC109615425 isoform X2 n=1 Tax=Esox lucius TaxID=8010 RepID=UPI001476C7F7|nr:uncharacterized protein LOC109615425 isoform X2 [Esox lucius]
MCHDTRTADRFYAISLNPTQAMEVRSLFQAALEGEDQVPVSQRHPSTSKPSERCKGKAAEDESLSEGSTSSEATKVQYQESGTSSPGSESESSSSSGVGQMATLPQTPPKRPAPESEEHPTPSKLPVTDRRSVMVSITPMKMSPLKSKSKTRHVSPVLTQQGIRKLRATSARLKRAIASRRLKMEGFRKLNLSYEDQM